jgi:putative oxidoreductase
MEWRRKMSVTVDVGLLILRIVVGLLFAGHGAQKLFGWFGGRGMAGHTGLMERLGMSPAPVWAWVNALAEFLGGLGLLFGLLTPLAAVGLLGSMIVAIVKVHGPKGVWNTNGGFEFPLTLAAVAFVVGLTGPGFYSLDQILGVRLPEPGTYVVALLAMLIVVAVDLIVPSVRHAHRTA